MNKILSERIKELRTIKGLTQKEFAESINVSTVSVSSYETGVKTPSLDMITCIAQKYSISIDWLCGLNDNMVSDNNITTYRDLLKLFIALLDTRYENKPTVPIINIIDTDNASVIITLNEDKNFQNFFSKWCDIFKLYCEKTIDEDLYKMWIEKQLEDYDRPINGCPF